MSHPTYYIFIGVSCFLAGLAVAFWFIDQAGAINCWMEKTAWVEVTR